MRERKRKEKKFNCKRERLAIEVIYDNLYDPIKRKASSRLYKED